jgi:two-component system, LytTR family, response regulator
MRALIADDEKSARLTLRSILETFFPEVEIVCEASSPHDALIMVDTYNPNLVFWDIQMGDQSRFEKLENILHKGIEVIIVSAERSSAYDSLPFKVTEYLLKPVRIKEMRLALEKCALNLRDDESPTVIS